MAKNKVAIKIKKSHYGPSVKGGCEFISVSCNASTYGQRSPCDNEEEIKSSIESCKKNIINHGDIPVVEDLRIKQKHLGGWLN